MSIVIGGEGAGGEPVLHVDGELDQLGAAELAEAVRDRLSTSPRTLTIDLSGTTYLNSSGARQLVAVTRETAAREVRLSVRCRRDNRAVWRVFDLLQLDAVVPIAAVDVEAPAPRAGGAT